MGPILDYGDEPRYTIKTVSKITGILPVTLRAWERRYQVLSPHRSDNRYRLYSERDVAILNWLKQRVDSGVSISSAVMELKRWLRVGDIAGGDLAGTPSEDSGPEETAARLYQALLRFNEAQALEQARSARERFDLRTLLLEVFTPVLRQVGEAWYFGEIGVTTEHFASAFILGQLLGLLHESTGPPTGRPVLVGCAPEERHEMGGLMFTIWLRSQGCRAQYLGPDLNLEDLADYVDIEKPAAVVLTASLPTAALRLRGFQERLRHIHPAPAFCFAGEAFNQDPRLRERTPGTFLGESFEQGAETLMELVGQRA